jgi:hypothetical protein
MRAGGVIDSQEDVGGWPEPPGPPPGPAPEDVDRDGMADTWELSQGLDPTDSDDRNAPDDRNAHDLDAGYTNLEVYLDFRTIPVPEAGSVSSWLVVALLVGLRPRRKRPRLGHRDDQPAFPRP